MSDEIKIDDMRAKTLVSALQAVQARVTKAAGGRKVCCAAHMTCSILTLLCIARFCLGIIK